MRQSRLRSRCLTCDCLGAASTTLTGPPLPPASQRAQSGLCEIHDFDAPGRRDRADIQQISEDRSLASEKASVVDADDDINHARKIKLRCFENLDLVGPEPRSAFHIHTARSVSERLAVTRSRRYDRQSRTRAYAYGSEHLGYYMVFDEELGLPADDSTR
jgi:hypothetical protein